MNAIDSGYILIIDDDKDICDVLAHLLERAGYHTQQGYDGATAIKLLSQREPDVLLLDSVIPEPNGMAVLAKARVLYPQLRVIIITGTAGILGAVCAIKAGAWDYLPKPFDNNRVLELVNRAVQTREKQCAPNDKVSKDTSDRILALMGNSSETQRIIKDIVRVAHTDFSVIIQGETGTGKELIAKNIHLASRRAAADFIPIDCGAMSESLIENELFGHEKGSYTGADHVCVGKFEAANGGTLFLDEIANMSLSAQAKLLRVIQERVVYRIGATKSIPVNVRLLAASNEDLLEAVVNGTFREDLYYRLNEYVIRLQPLRNRHEDILFLAHRFLTETCIELGKVPLDFSVAAKDALLRYPWPGNVRELRTVIRRAALVSDIEVGIDDLGLIIRESALTSSTKKNYPGSMQNCYPEGATLREITQLNIDEIERIIIQDTLKKTGNNKAEAARRLNIDYKTLRAKLKKINNLEVK
ncbi:sigma-54-dependent transcriptional regulator [Methylobacter psychrophilus]|uniref:sigma-54-dependent transcriptional regulator n=1 Tax=Methylobacter psychrophilus TaxID=96941 RepID=UPI0021D4B91C|nr:sigma-54 dependent transcriptional regulator [Methylobacter psychrophilus]